MSAALPESTSGPTRPHANRRLAGRLLLVVVAMFGFGYALVPLYDVFCRLTGLNGKPANRAAILDQVEEDPNRWVTLELLVNTPLGPRGNADDWDFRPATPRLRVHPGGAYTTRFFARNPASVPRVVQAIASVAPGEAARYLLKTECFCFTQQRFDPGEQREMPLHFVIDPALPAEIGTLSLAYSLYEVNP